MNTTKLMIAATLGVFLHGPAYANEAGVSGKDLPACSVENPNGLFEYTTKEICETRLKGVWLPNGKNSLPIGTPTGRNSGGSFPSAQVDNGALTDESGRINVITNSAMPRVNVNVR